MAKAGIAQNVAELLQKIANLKTMVSEPTRFERILQLYGDAVGLEERNGLEKKAMREYCSYLWHQREYRRAGYWMERYKRYMELDGADDDIADACNGVGTLYSDTGRMAEAETEYQRAKEIREWLASENPGAYLPNLASTCNDLGNLYSGTGRMQEAEAEYLRSKEIRERLATENPGAYLPGLAGTFNNLGNLYSDTGRMQEAEEEYLRAKEIYGQLATENPGAYLSYVADICNNLGVLYKGTGRMREAEAEYLRAKEIRERLAEKHPRAYLPGLIRMYGNLIILYGKEMGDEERAMSLFEEMQVLQARLDALNGKEQNN